MATGNIISICNRSLLAAGSRSQISSLNEGSAASNTLSILYQPTFEQLGRSAYWNCLRQQVTLTLLAAAAGTPENPQGTTLPLPPSPWLYSYQLPPDCLQARSILPTFPAQAGGGLGGAFVSACTTIAGRGQIAFQVAYGTDVNNNPMQVIVTNQTQAQLVYTVNQPNPSIWDSLFSEAMVSALAAFIITPLNLNLPLLQTAVARAEAIIAQARIRDGDEGTTSQDHIPDWIQARSGGVGYSGVWGGCNWVNVAWPG